MEPRMSAPELNLFAAFVHNARGMLEFGCGGSTVFASRTGRGFLESIDSSAAWVEKVGKAVAAQPASRSVHLKVVDIGVIGDWGMPKDEEKKPMWSRYHEEVWHRLDVTKIDFVLIDGRFRLACFYQCLLRLCPGTFVAFHDLAARSLYMRARQVAREVATSENLSVFQTNSLSQEQREHVGNLLLSHRFDPR